MEYIFSIFKASIGCALKISKIIDIQNKVEHCSYYFLKTMVKHLTFHTIYGFHQGNALFCLYIYLWIWIYIIQYYVVLIWVNVNNIDMKYNLIFQFLHFLNIEPISARNISLFQLIYKTNISAILVFYFKYF